MRILTLFLFCTGLFSCAKDLQTNLIEGTLKESCGGKKIIHAEVILMESSKQKIITSSTTDSKGYFSMSYEMDEDIEGNAELKFFNEKQFETIMSSIPLSQSLQFVAKKINSSEVLVFVQRSSAPAQDTLIFSITETDAKHQLIAPNSGDSTIIQLQLPSTYISNTDKKLFWGLGEEDYQKAKSSLESSNPYHVIGFSAKTCETHRVTIEI